MESGTFKRGEIRDAIVDVLTVSDTSDGLPTKVIADRVEARLKRRVPPSSIRSSLNIHTPVTFSRVSRGKYTLSSDQLRGTGSDLPTQSFSLGGASLLLGDAFGWLREQNAETIHAVVTDPPYGLVEYTSLHQTKLRNGRGGVWRIPPSFDGNTRSPLPRFTTLSSAELDAIDVFFRDLGKELKRVLVPGGHVMIASNPLVSHRVSSSLERSGLERRGEIIRLVQTMRGGDRPKNAEKEFNDVSVMPRSQWEPWVLFRKPMEGTVAQNLRKWGTGGLRRINGKQPFGDVIRSSPTGKSERLIANHPSLKPQALLRQLVRASLPLGEGIVLDPFSGSGSTLAAANAVGYESIGVERDPKYFELACSSIEPLSRLTITR